MRIGYISVGNPNDVTYWSGIPYWTVRSLRAAGHHVELICRLRTTAKYVFLIQKIAAMIANSNFQAQRTRLVTISYAKQITRIIKKAGPFDLLLSDSSIPVSDLKTDIPAVFWTDATADMMIGYYKDKLWSLENSARRVAVAQEQRALERCTFALYASPWASRHVASNFDVKRSKIITRPFGPNMNVPRHLDTATLSERLKNFEVCKLLFIGRDWDRKGGPLTVAIVARLLALGVKASLTVVGCQPFAAGKVPDFVRQDGLINKSTQDGQDALASLYNSHHFFIMPSTAEAMGVVFVEAAAHALPAISTETGGISAVVINNKTGLLFSSDAGVEVYADRIIGVIKNPDIYIEMCRNARAVFEECWSWDVIIRDIEALVTTQVL